MHGRYWESTCAPPPDDHQTSQSSCTINGTYWVAARCATETFMQCRIVRSLHIVFYWSWDEKDYHVCLPEEVGRGWPLWNILPRVITNWLSVSQRASVLGSHQEGPHFSNQGLRLGPVVEKAKTAFTTHCSKSISDDPRYFISQRSTLSDLLCLPPLQIHNTQRKTQMSKGMQNRSAGYAYLLSAVC